MSLLNNANVLQAITPTTNLTSAQANQVLEILVNNGQESAESLRDLVNRVSTVGQGDMTLLFSGGNRVNGSSKSHSLINISYKTFKNKEH